MCHSDVTAQREAEEPAKEVAYCKTFSTLLATIFIKVWKAATLRSIEPSRSTAD